MRNKKKSGVLYSVALALIVLFLSATVKTRSAEALGKITILKDAAEALGDAADSFSKIVDSFAHLIKTGTKGYDIVSARLTHGRLRNLSARLTQLGSGQTTGVINPIWYYLEDPHPSIWKQVTNKLELVLETVNSILSEVKAERSDFVLESTYFDMVKTIQTRAFVLRKLIEMDPPISQKDLDELRIVHNKYRLLVLNLRRATQELNAYIKMVDSNN